MMGSVGFHGHLLASHMRGGIALAYISQEQYDQEENIALRHLYRGCCV
jgi:hypothetical protein